MLLLPRWPSPPEAATGLRGRVQQRRCACAARCADPLVRLDLAAAQTRAWHRGADGVKPATLRMLDMPAGREGQVQVG